MKLSKSLLKAIRNVDVDIITRRSNNVRSLAIKLLANGNHYRVNQAAVLVIAAELEMALLERKERWPVVVDADGDSLHIELLGDTDAELARAMRTMREVASAIGI